MKSFFNSLNRRIVMGGGIILLALLLTACPGTNNGNVTDDDKSQKIQVFSQEVGMSFISMVLKYTGDDTPVSWGINLYKADNLGKSLDYEYESYNKNVILKFDNRAGKIIDAGTEYIIKITMKDSNYDELTKNLSITTKAKGSPQIKSCTYESGTSPYVKVTYDEAPSFLKKLELWRSESESGEYTKVNETTYFYSSLEIKDTKVDDSKTYYYKLKAYENTGSDSEPNYLLLGESNILSVETGIKKPFEVDETKSKKQNFIIFIIFSIIGLILTEIIMYIGSDVLKISYLIVKIVATAIVMVFNFVTRKIFLEKK